VAAPALTDPEQRVVPPDVSVKVTLPVASPARPDAERATALPYAVLVGFDDALKDGVALVMAKLVDPVDAA
jgi:hypothetical protein